MQQQQQSYVAYGEPQPIGYIPGGAIQAPPRRLPDATCLRFFIMVLLFLGIVQLFSIQGILALTIVCKFGCGCSSSHQILRSLTGREGCCSLNCRGVATAFFSALTILAGSFGMQFLSNICGIVVTDTTNDVQKLAYNAGLAAIGVAEGVWQLRHPSLSAPVDTESSAGTFAWAFVYPSDVCDIMPKELKFSGNGIYYPRPLSSFADQIRIYIIVVNTVTILTVFAVCRAASKLRTAYLNQSNVITRPLAYAAMP